MPSLLFFAGVTGFVIVAFGAFGAHGLDARLTADAKDWWETATLYGLAHSVAALSIALSPSAPKHAGAAFLIGVLLFSGSLYGMALGAPTWFGVITPLGGVLFLIGWALIITDGLRRRKSE